MYVIKYLTNCEEKWKDVCWWHDWSVCYQISQTPHLLPFPF